jgi:hypothetical protein
MTLPPVLISGDDVAVHALSAHGEPRWWWTPGGERALDDCLAAALGRRWPAYAAAVRIARASQRPERAAWRPVVAAFLRDAGIAARGLVSQLGTPGHYRKHATLVLGPDRLVTGILKSSDAPASRGSIRAEIDALAALRDRLPAELPRPLGCIEAGEHVFSLQSPVQARRSDAWTAAHRDLLVAMLRTAPRARWDDAFVPRERVREALAACGGAAARLASLCGRLRELAEPELGSLPLGWTHRDFTPANAWCERGRLAVIDWEWADPAWAPGHDLIHFHLVGALRRGGDAAPLAAMLAEERSPLAELCRAAGIGHRPATLLALYLYDLILFYADANGEGLARAPAHPLIASAAALAGTLVEPSVRPAGGAVPALSKVQTLRE